MTWFRVDDGMPSHPKTRSIPRRKRMSAIGVWTSCGAWSSRHLTDGLVPADVVLDEGGRPSDAAALVTAGLWHATGHDCDRCPPVPAGHYLFHDWSSPWNPTRERVESDRRAVADRVAKHRAKIANKAAAADAAGLTGNAPGNSLHTPPPSRPVPSLPKHLLTLVCRRLQSDARVQQMTDDDRTELWAMWADAAGPDVDLEAELRLWFMRNAETDLRDPAAALLGWLRKARQRAAAGPLGCAACSGGWLPDDVDTGRPVPCPNCRPHLRPVAS